MSFLNERLSKRMQDPEFRREWEDSELEYTIARNIIRMRQERNLTQKDLASALHTTQSVVSRIENANQNLSIDTLKGIAHVFGVNVVDILQAENEELVK